MGASVASLSSSLVCLLILRHSCCVASVASLLSSLVCFGVGDREQAEVLNTLLDDEDVYSAAELISRQRKWRS